MSRYAASHRVRRRWPPRAAGLVVLGTLMVLAGAGWLLAHSTRSTAQPRADAGAGAYGDALAGPVAGSTRPAVASATLPIRLRIPSIQVDTALQPLGLQPDGTLQAPSQWQVAGWFRAGVHPGSPGPAVIAGHIDSRSGPAVFSRLHELRGGEIVFITRADRSVVRFVVDDIARYRKDNFPAAMVYGPQPLPVLRLITCTGAFDTHAHSYLENLVVSAHLT